MKNDRLIIGRGTRVVFPHSDHTLRAGTVVQLNMNGTYNIKTDVQLGGGTTQIATNVVLHINHFMELVNNAGFAVCHNCWGHGRIDPIENPPYQCTDCDGKGYTISWAEDLVEIAYDRQRKIHALTSEKIDLLKQIDELRAEIAEWEAMDEEAPFAER